MKITGWKEALGPDSLFAKLQKEEEKILDFQRKNPNQMIVQQPVENLNKLMNPMTYDKAGWMLRMLRYQVGEDTFQKIILAFYEQYKYDIASTQNFIAVANDVSDANLDKFFEQWFYTPGAPDVLYNWNYKKGKLKLNFEQQTDYVYQLDFDVRVSYKNGSIENKRVSLSDKTQAFEISGERVNNIEIDPFNVTLGKFKKK